MGRDKKPTPAKIAAFVKFVESKGLNSRALDDLVHDLKAGEAADINNGGLLSQAEYVLAACGTKGATKAIQDLVYQEGEDKREADEDAKCPYCGQDCGGECDEAQAGGFNE